MHVLVPYASADSQAARHVLADLELPNLARMLAVCDETLRDDGPADSYSPPQERALAAAWYWVGSDGTLPFAAHAAAADGIDVGTLAWAVVTPCHWLLGRDHALMADPKTLALSLSHSRQLFDAVRALFQDDGFAFCFGAADRWYAGRDDLQGFATASVDRVVHRDIEAWIGHDSAEHVQTRRTLRRLQSEAQLVFHSHAVNDARESAGLPVVNSFWLSGCGRAQPADPHAMPRLVTELREPLLAADWVAWADAWRRVDTGVICEVTAACEAAGGGSPTQAASLTLCGERSASRWSRRPRSAWRRWRDAWRAGPRPHEVLSGL